MLAVDLLVGGQARLHLGREEEQWKECLCVYVFYCVEEKWKERSQGGREQGERRGSETGKQGRARVNLYETAQGALATPSTAVRCRRKTPMHTACYCVSMGVCVCSLLCIDICICWCIPTVCGCANRNGALWTALHCAKHI